MNGISYICNDDRNVEINNRIYDRNIPTQPLQAQFSHRPVATKYDMMSIIDRRAIPTVPIIRQPTYNISNVSTAFPPTASGIADQGPWSGYASKINDESKMKHIFFARQEGAQAAYIPSSTSDMYQVYVGERHDLPDQQPFPDLFATHEFKPFNTNPHGIATNFFDNCTRQQIKEVKPLCQ
uniref:Uncharacterized protein n=1 Tax=viral metagenome TaxID=1070528 RepID=A0A6C0HH66_9ZZZZ